ncbi:hypothetical protein JOD62_000074 [Microbacterium keratanolyticum]|uniref:Uncharacterized protein n=2 Tax=Microbacterium keratanolyticum TaxID=67574 RepID=A0A9W6HUC3_9MICO|nr:hypothetical protein [Microbacterium keratanolyticum]MBM7467526.1 hypothetical protein [Microbacterium keratanolyticum]GLK02515.1 hypothetical protein GCM10017596_22300 [Microbacterium keratanolyticum]
MIGSFILFMVLFLGGFWCMGIAHELPQGQALVFCAGLALVSIALAWVMRTAGGATRRNAKDGYGAS